MNWEIDAVHSQATFAVKHLMMSTVKGRFNLLRGKLNIDQERPENSWDDVTLFAHKEKEDLTR